MRGKKVYLEISSLTTKTFWMENILRRLKDDAGKGKLVSKNGR